MRSVRAGHQHYCRFLFCRSIPDVVPSETRGIRRRDLKLGWKDGVITTGELTVPKSKTEAGTGRTIPLTRRACAALTLWLSRFPEADTDRPRFPHHNVGVASNRRRAYFYEVDLMPVGEWKKDWEVASRSAVCYR